MSKKEYSFYTELISFNANLKTKESHILCPIIVDIHLHKQNKSVLNPSSKKLIVGIVKTFVNYLSGILNNCGIMMIITESGLISSTNDRFLVSLHLFVKNSFTYAEVQGLLKRKEIILEKYAHFVLSGKPANLAYLSHNNYLIIKVSLSQT